MATQELAPNHNAKHKWSFLAILIKKWPKTTKNPPETGGTTAPATDLVFNRMPFYKDLDQTTIFPINKFVSSHPAIPNISGILALIVGSEMRRVPRLLFHLNTPHQSEKAGVGKEE